MRDKQEELDAAQCQAHWIVLQQESVISETSEELIAISDLVNDWLSECGSQIEPEEVGPLLFSLPHTPVGFATLGVNRGPHTSVRSALLSIFRTEFFHSLKQCAYILTVTLRSLRCGRVSIQAEDFFSFQENKGEDVSEISIKEYPRIEDESFPAPKSLVQSVLEATSMRENETESPAVVSKLII